MTNNRDFDSVDFYNIDELLTEEQKLIRGTVRDFVTKEINPFIEGGMKKVTFPLRL